MSRHEAPENDPATKEILEFLAEKNVDTSKDGWKTRLPKPPKVPFDSKLTYLWKLETSKGPLTVKLRPDEAPMHVASTLYLTMLGFYDDLVFHRVIPGFMAQGGCPLGTGTGGPGYQYDGEFGALRHDKKGLLSMANAGPGTDGSQFFLTFVATPWLDGNHSIFGEVIEGDAALDALEACGSDSGRTSEKLLLKSARIEVS
ncbi:MAG: peptidylprolyl isomerase [Planctomycetota bacterium JB042]